MLELTGGDKKRRAEEVAQEIRKEIAEVTGCTASVGIGNKYKYKYKYIFKYKY